MKIKFAEDIARKIKDKGPVTVPDGYITGEDYENWLYGDDNDDRQIQKHPKTSCQRHVN